MNKYVLDGILRSFDIQARALEEIIRMAKNSPILTDESFAILRKAEVDIVNIRVTIDNVRSQIICQK